MPHDPRRTLRELGDEFRLASASSDGYYVNVRLDAAPLRKRGGRLSFQVLDLIDAAVQDNRTVAMDSEWEGGDGSECERELFLCRREGGTAVFLEVFEEYAAGVIRCLRDLPRVAKALGVTGDRNDDTLGAMLDWREVLMRLALRGEHPVLRATAGKLTKPRGMGDDYFQMGAYTILVPKTATEERIIEFIPSDDPEEDCAKVIARLKRLTKAFTSIEEIKCGVLRGSAYAIDWILEEYAGDA